MAKYDVFARRSGAGYLLDCQADLLSQLNTRFVVPLLPAREAPKPAARLNPIFDLEGGSYVMTTQFAAAVPVAELGERIASLGDQDTVILNALDMLISGF
ncbi:MAG TPA: CcdB family protein [Allosphingosinicella sp.]|nr:CcdB family protein [Allosphingosinicella sp.]